MLILSPENDHQIEKIYIQLKHTSIFLKVYVMFIIEQATYRLLERSKSLLAPSPHNSTKNQ